VHGRSGAAIAWLSLTPEPEYSLPDRLAVLSDLPGRSEEDLITDLVLRGTGRRWRHYLDRVAELVCAIADGTRNGDPELAITVAQVVLDHDRLLIGLPGRDYVRTAERRRRLAEAVENLEARLS
jgi:hypothetical protein